MPNTPSFIEKVGFIRKWWSIKCETPWIIYFETGGKALKNAMLTLLSFGMDDVLRGYFRPKDTRTGRHGKKRRKRRKGGKEAMPELGEKIGQNLPGHEEIKGRKTSDGIKHLWEIDGKIQRALYYWMIADLVTDFAYDWLSGIMKDPASNCALLARGYAEASNVPINGRDQWIAIPHGITRYEKWPVDMNSQLISLGSGKFHIVHKANIFNDSFDPAVVQIAVVQGGETWNFVGVSDRKEMGPFTKGDFIAEATLDGPGVILLLGWTNHFVLFEHTSAMAVGGEVLTKEGL